jgi:hypothetical protein
MTRSELHSGPAEPGALADAAPDGRLAVEILVVSTVTQMLQDLERSFPGPIMPHTLLVGDLGCNSLDVAMLIALVNRQLQLADIPFEKLLYTNGRPVTDLSLQMVIDFMWNHSSDSAYLGAVAMLPP